MQFVFRRELYALCQTFPDVACQTMQSILRDAGHSMEEALEVKGHASFPGLDMVWIRSCEHHNLNMHPCVQCTEIVETPLLFVILVFFFKLIYLKVTALLFPTSDFRHPVTSPALLYISQALTKVQAAFSVLLNQLKFCFGYSCSTCLCMFVKVCNSSVAFFHSFLMLYVRMRC